MTHGDMLSDDDRIEARIFLSDMLGVLVDHIFDIAGITFHTHTLQGNESLRSATNFTLPVFVECSADKHEHEEMALLSNM